jgi:hypothetical protein
MSSGDGVIFVAISNYTYTLVKKIILSLFIDFFLLDGPWTSDASFRGPWMVTKTEKNSLLKAIF